MKKIVFLSLAVLCLSVWPARAQEVSAGITGRVTDPSGSSIVGASVSAKDLDRGTDWPTKTNEDGIYAFPRIPVGRYELKVEAAGFKTYVNSEVALEVNQRARVDVAMQVGAITESVSVVGEAPLLQTDTTQVGAVIAASLIDHTPLISRNPIALTLLTAGVTNPDPSTFNSGQRGAGGGRPYVNGNREEDNNFMLDGVDNNFTSDNLVSYQPNPDALEEVKLITNNASAEFGNFQGGIINMVIKSGTNQFHGDLFEYFRNDKLNANNWGNNWNGVPRGPLRWNQFGGTLGGRIFKDKLFFFIDYQGLRRNSPPTLSATTVMPSAWRTGDFSALLDTSQTGAKSPIQLYNPFSLDSSTGLRAPFPNNVIPQSMLDPAAVKLMTSTFYPQPQYSRFSTSNYYYSAWSQLYSDQGDMKLDWRPNDKDYFTARISKGRQDNPGLNNLPIFYGSFNIAPFQNGVINWTRTISPRMVNEFRFGVNNIDQWNGGLDEGLGNLAQSVGIQNAGIGLLAIGAAIGNGGGFNWIHSLGSSNIGFQQFFNNTTWHYADNLTLIRGRHMMKMGGQILREWINAFYASNSGRSGGIDFGGRFTAQNALNPTGTLIGEADFMLGLPDDIALGLQGNTWGHRSTVYGLYFQDDWRATNNLTLNLGLRWEYNSPWVEVENRQSNFNEWTGQLELAAPLPAGLQAPPGSAPMIYGNRALYQPYKKDFQPRVGFAWTPDFLSKKIVLRGAYTISSFLEGTGTNLRETLNPPFNHESETRYNLSGQFPLPGSTLDQGLSSLSAKDPYAAATIRLWDPLDRPAEVQQWNLSMDIQMPQQNILTVGYVGQHGDHLMVAMPYLQNQLIGGTVVQGPYLSGNPALRSEISQISGTASIGRQGYNSLQATLRKRFATGLEYQVAFTYSHGMSDSIGYYGQGGQSGSQSAYWQYLYCQACEMGPTYFDEKFMFVPTFTYQLPFGRGRHFGSAWSKPVDGLIGGWQIGGIYTARTGFPLTIKMSGDPSGTGARSFRANVIGTPNDPHNVGPGALWLDPSAYAQPALHTIGDAGVGIVRGPGMSRLDFSLSKQFHITERKFFELRGEAFNLFNTPIFLSPASQTITSTLFGQIRSSEGERNMQIVAKFYF
ncbi:MAG TPA: carboxypeptidase regulatory-like domain-containing protein [Bryobacteraceae bacterium]|nr:carboxypeptidase regulatory-like domain-containing protein [Bryobacteraceae bacterium]